MKRSIYITEICSEGEGGNLFDYNLLPIPIKNAVDNALKDPNLSYVCDIYKEGLQFLWQYVEKNNIKLLISKNEQTEYLGSVCLYHNE